MSGVWYSASGSSNIFKSSYVNGFLDVSNMFLTRGDASMAGNVYIGGNAGLNVNNSMSMNGVINQLIGVPMISNSLYFGGTAINDSYVGGRLYVYYDASINGRLFVTQDASINGLTVGKGGGSNGLNTVLGNVALQSNTTGSRNTAIGSNALQLNTAGYNNTAVGQSALAAASGNNNVAVGQGALASNTGGSNTACGQSSLTANTSGVSNTACGMNALPSNSTGSYNTAVGYVALQTNNANYNTAVGLYALRYNTTAANNTALGVNAGINNNGISGVNAQNNTYLGANTDIDSSANAWAYSTAVGYSAKITASNQITLGTASEKVYVPGDASMNGNLTIGKDLLVNGNLSVKQYSTNLTVYTVNYNNFTVAQDMSLNGRLYLLGDASMNGRLFVGGDASFNANSYIAGNLGIGKTGQYALDISGSIQTSVASTSATYKNLYSKTFPNTAYLSTFSPNSSNASAWTWTNNNITWTVSQSSAANANEQGSNIFDTTNARWVVGNYTAANFGAYTGTVTTPNIQGVGIINGEWVQLRASVPIVMKTYSMTTWTGNVNYLSEFPGRYFIVGSNDGVSWNRIIDVSFTSNPITTTNVNGGTVTIPTTTTTGGNINTITANTAAGSVTGTFNTYDTTTQAYTYFRIIITNKNTGGALLEQYITIGEWTPTFSLVTPTGPSSTILYMDASNINQLDVSGSLGLINSNPSTMLISPNSANATTWSWTNNNIIWTASGSSYWTSAIPCAPFQAFSPLGSTGFAWETSTQTYYNTTNGSVLSTVPYGTLVNTGSGPVTVSGEWLQIQSSVPLIMSNYYFANRWGGTSSAVAYQADLPASWTIAGSNDGTTWFKLQDASCTALPGISGSVATSQQITSTYTLTTTTTLTTQPATSANANITGFAAASNAYTYFRLIIRGILTGFTGMTATNAGNKDMPQLYFFPFFRPATSAVSMSLDNALPNQLNVGGAVSVSTIDVGTHLTISGAKPIMMMELASVFCINIAAHKSQNNSGTTYTIDNIATTWTGTAQTTTSNPGPAIYGQVPINARYIMGDIFLSATQNSGVVSGTAVAASACDACTYFMGRNSPAGGNTIVLWSMAKGGVVGTANGFNGSSIPSNHCILFSLPGESDGYTDFFGRWLPNVWVPINPYRQFVLGDNGNSGSSLNLFMVIRGYSL